MSGVDVPVAPAWRAALEYPTLSAPRLSSRGDVAVEVTRADGTVEVDVIRSSRTEAVEVVEPSETSSRRIGHAPAWSPDGDRLAVADGSAIRIEDLGADTVAVLDVGSGLRVEALTWHEEQFVVALVAPVEADTAVGAGAIRHSGGDAPIVRALGTGARRLIEVPVDGGDQREVDADGMTIWEATPVPGGGYVAIASDGPLETDWYRSVVIHIDAASGVRELHRSDWQLARPSVDPSGTRAVVVEGWSSDRGHLAGDARLIDLTTGASTSWAIPGVDVVAFEWIDDERIAYSGWSDCTSSAGTCDSAGRTDDHLLDPAVLRDRTTRIVDGVATTAAVRWTAGRPPAVVTFASGSHPDPDDGPSCSDVAVQELAWSADDGTEIHGLLCTPSDAPAACPLIVMVHGGPANLWSRQLTIGALALVAEGFAVLLPNPRGSVGRGQAYARSNLRDPGGAELGDVLAGATHCRRTGLVASGAPGIIGGSYGGYLTSCAATFGHDVAAAVMMFGHPDLISARFGSNNPAFYDILVGGPPDRDHLDTYVRCSPVLHAHPGAAPTLILHGDADACTPLNQGEEFFMALREQHVTTELVVYPNSGHGLRDASTQADVWARVTAWFRHHLEAST